MISDSADTAFELLPGNIAADGVRNEMERLHFVIKDGLYYLWSSQSSVLAPEIPRAPTGLYSMVGASLQRPYAAERHRLSDFKPGSGTRQIYCWQALDTLEVYSFIDDWSLEGRNVEQEQGLLRSHFGGTIAPVLKIEIQRNTTRLLGLA